MKDTKLAKKHCVPCEGGQVAALSIDAIQSRLGQLKGWRLNGNQIEKDFSFKDFREVMDFVNRVAEIAESEGHHPDLLIHQYRQLKVTLWTHATSGLTDNDFILAAKIDEIS